MGMWFIPSKLKSTLRIQVCPKKGILPAFLLFSDGIGTLNPIRSGGVWILRAALSAWASDTIEPSCFRTWTWYSSWPRSLEGEFGVVEIRGSGLRVEPRVLRFFFFFRIWRWFIKGGGNQEVCNSKILDLFLFKVIFYFLPMVNHHFAPPFREYLSHFAAKDWALDLRRVYRGPP